MSTLETVSIDSGTPMAAFGQSDAPLQGDRVGATQLHRDQHDAADDPGLAARAWEACPASWTRSRAASSRRTACYTAEVLMHFNADAFSMRFDPEHVAAAEAAAAEQPQPRRRRVEVAPGAVRPRPTDGTTDGEGN